MTIKKSEPIDIPVNTKLKQPMPEESFYVGSVKQQHFLNLSPLKFSELLDKSKESITSTPALLFAKKIKEEKKIFPPEATLKHLK